AAADSAYADAAGLFKGKSLRVAVRFKRPATKPSRAAPAGKVSPRAARDVERRRRILATGVSNEQGFHYPQGVHLGHLLAIIEGLARTKRRPREFEKRYIRLEGELGSGRISAYRRQLKYKLSAAMGFGLIAPSPTEKANGGPDIELTSTGRQ